MTISRLFEGRFSFLKFIMANLSAINLTFALVCYYFPPAILNMICYARSYPVITRVRGLQLTLREVLVRSFLNQLANILPLAIFFAGIFALVSGNLKMALTCFVIALMMYYLVRIITCPESPITIGAWARCRPDQDSR